jgi:cytosine/uracil/thiamine/allantoin permease
MSQLDKLPDGYPLMSYAVQLMCITKEEEAKIMTILLIIIMLTAIGLVIWLLKESRAKIKDIMNHKQSL